MVCLGAGGRCDDHSCVGILPGTSVQNMHFILLHLSMMVGFSARRDCIAAEYVPLMTCWTASLAVSSFASGSCAGPDWLPVTIQTGLSTTVVTFGGAVLYVSTHLPPPVSSIVSEGTVHYHSLQPELLRPLHAVAIRLYM
jgi:hypothetical protein